MSSQQMLRINLIIKHCVSCWITYILQDDTRSIQYQVSFFSSLLIYFIHFFLLFPPFFPSLSLSSPFPVSHQAISHASCRSSKLLLSAIITEIFILLKKKAVRRTNYKYRAQSFQSETFLPKFLKL